MKTRIDKIAVLFTLCVVVVSLFSGYALADVIWEPEDSFYAKHSNECEYYNSDCYSNGETGYMPIFSRPGGKILGYTDNGLTYHLQFTYEDRDGTVWAICEVVEKNGRYLPREGDSFVNAWVKLSDTLDYFDSSDFLEKYAGELKEYEGNLSELSGKTGILTWTYPRSGVVSNKLDTTDEGLTFSQVYTDSEGLCWGYCSYHYGMRDLWICLSDPTNENIEAMNVPKPQIIEPQDGQEPPTARDYTSIVIIAVLVVVVVSALLIVLPKRKVKSK